MPYRNKTTGEIISDIDYQQRFGGGSVIQETPQRIPFTQTEQFNPKVLEEGQEAERFLGKSFAGQFAELAGERPLQTIYPAAGKVLGEKFLKAPSRLFRTVAEYPETILREGAPAKTTQSILGKIPFVGKQKSLHTEQRERLTQDIEGRPSILSGEGGDVTQSLRALTPFAQLPLDIAETVILAKFTKEFGGEIIKDIGKTPVGTVVKGASRFRKLATGTAKDIFSGGKELDIIQRELAEQPLQRLSIQNTIRDVRASSKETSADMIKSFKEANQTIQRNLAREAQLQSESTKGPLRELFKNVSKTYGEGLSKAEDTLEKSGTTLKSSGYLKVLDDTLEEFRFKGIPEENPVFDLLLKYQKQLLDFLNKNGRDAEISLRELKTIRQGVYDTLSSSVKTGTKYAEIDDHAANIFLKNYGEFMGKLSPELSKLNKEFAPMANARGWAMRNFRPYNTQEVQRGANVLERIAKSDVPNKTDLNYLKVLEEGSGRFSGAGKLTGKTLEIGKETKGIKESFDVAKYNLLKSTDLKIYNLRTELAELQSRGIVLGQRLDELKLLLRIRNIIIGATIGIAVSKFLPKPIKKLLPFI